jgi:hypothetical protein
VQVNAQRYACCRWGPNVASHHVGHAYLNVPALQNVLEGSRFVNVSGTAADTLCCQPPHLDSRWLAIAGPRFRSPLCDGARRLQAPGVLLEKPP